MIFVCYAHEDTDFAERMVVALKAQQLQHFIDAQIHAGAAWKPTIDAQLESATVGILLISSYFLASQFIRETELPRLAARHRCGSLTLLPVLLTNCKPQCDGLDAIHWPLGEDTVTERETRDRDEPYAIVASHAGNALCAMEWMPRWVGDGRTPLDKRFIDADFHEICKRRGISPVGANLPGSGPVDVARSAGLHLASNRQAPGTEAVPRLAGPIRASRSTWWLHIDIRPPTQPGKPSVVRWKRGSAKEYGPHGEWEATEQPDLRAVLAETFRHVTDEGVTAVFITVPLRARDPDLSQLEYQDDFSGSTGPLTVAAAFRSHERRLYERFADAWRKRCTGTRDGIRVGGVAGSPDHAVAILEGPIGEAERQAHLQDATKLAVGLRCVPQGPDRLTTLAHLLRHGLPVFAWSTEPGLVEELFSSTPIGELVEALYAREKTDRRTVLVYDMPGEDPFEDDQLVS